VIDEDQIAHPNLPETHPERVHPETVGVLRITGGDVSGDTLVEAETTEDPKRRCEPLLAVQALLRCRTHREWVVLNTVRHLRLLQ
jgi:hypothetical protein